MSHPAAQHGWVPSAVVRSGALGQVGRRPSVLGTYLVYCAHANPQWEAWVSAKTIAASLGVSLEAVRRARRALERQKLLVATGRSRGRCSIYRLAADPQQVWGYRTPTGVGVDPQQARTWTPNRRWHEQALKRAAEQRAAAAGAAEPGQAERADVLAALDKVGIGEPTRSRLAAAAHVTPTLIAQVAKRLDGKARTPGLLVRALEAESNRLAAADQAAIAAEAQLNDRQVALLQELRRHWPRLKANNAWLSRPDLTPERVQKAVANAAGDLTKAARLLNTPEAARGGTAQEGGRG